MMTRPKLRVLVVDDSRADYEVISRELRKVDLFDCRPTHQPSSRGCRSSLKADEIDCLLLDYRLGAESGLELLSALRDEGSEHPIIMLTGQGDEQVAVEAMKRGAHDYLSKDGITHAVLRRAIANAVEKARLERTLQEKQRELEGFVSVVAHDLRNPVCSAKDALEVIRDFYQGKPLDARASELMDGATTSLKRMSRLIDSLLDHARKGRSEIKLETVDLNELVREVLVDLPKVAGDRVGLGQLLQNLIANALKFCRKEHPLVIVKSHLTGGWAEVCVADNGIGIEPQHLKTIFKPFHRLHSRDEYDGSGLGLATCQRIVERHGGRIWVESIPGEGSTFHFRVGQEANC